jgi:cell division protein FtsL
MKIPFANGLVFGGLALVLLFLSFVSLWQRDQMTRVGYAIQKMQQQKEKLTKQHKELLIEVESLSALDRIEDIAMLQLSMVQALPGERIYVRQGPLSNASR